jgi:HSP20 family molecular chaperone IbpA
VDVDKVDADIKDGVLTLILPKVSAAKTKKVKVKSES